MIKSADRRRAAAARGAVRKEVSGRLPKARSVMDSGPATIERRAAKRPPRVLLRARARRGHRLWAPWIFYPCGVALILLLTTVMRAVGLTEPRLSSAIPYLLAVLLVAIAWGPGPAVVASLVSGTVFNYYFVPPANAFTIPTPQELSLAVAMLTISAGVGAVADRMRMVQRDAEALAASERLQKTLLSSVSHDLRTPLTTIMGSLTTLLAEEGPVGRIDAATRHELLAMAYDRAKALNRLVEQIIEMTRLEAGPVRLRREWESLHHLVRTALDLLGAPVRDRCRLRIPGDAPEIPMDDTLLAHAVGNVLENAARYAPPGSPIDIDGARDGASAVLSIADRGPGIPPGDLGRIFDKFYRLHPGTSAGDGGIGLGLAIAKGIVEAHGGRIWAEARDGGGTVVRIALPLR